MYLIIIYSVITRLMVLLSVAMRLGQSFNKMIKMTIKKMMLILGIIMGASTSTMLLANTSQDTQTIFKQLAAHQLVRANFVQQKQLPSINKTFQSTGTLTFSKSLGVLWQIQTPIQADLVMTSQKLVQKTERTQSQISLDKSPYGAVANVFLQLMTGDQKTLDKNFNVEYVAINRQVQPMTWSIRLVPKSNLLKKLFDRVEASGDQYVQRMFIQEKANSTTTIQFSQHRTSPTQLIATEHALFQLAK